MTASCFKVRGYFTPLLAAGFPALLTCNCRNSGYKRVACLHVSTHRSGGIAIPMIDRHCGHQAAVVQIQALVNRGSSTMTRVAILFSVLAIYAVIPSNGQAQETASRDQTGPAAGQSPASALLNRFDKNSDGRITENEVPQQAWAS